MTNENSFASMQRPFIGLRPFEYEDRLFFFGRDASVKAIEPLVASSRFVAIIGSSGTGKSSLIRAGLLPQLLESSDPVWRAATMRPGEAPLRQLAIALTSLAAASEELADAWTDRIESILRASSFGIPESVALFPPSARSKRLLLIVDQFEELFRFANVRSERSTDIVTSAEHRDEATAFVRLLLNAGAAELGSVNVVITMRSDFIGDCTHFHGLPEAVTSSQYLVPGLTRDQRANTVQGPVERANGKIEAGLVQRILNDTNEDPDQLPVIQHAMMRSWHIAFERAQEKGTPVEVTTDDYLEIGAITDALSQHANEVLNEIVRTGNNSSLHINFDDVTKRIFQSLTEVDQDGRVSRRPQRFEELTRCIGRYDSDEPSTAAAKIVIEKFSEPGCSFLRAPNSIRWTGASIIDIGHEALIRRWDKLRGDGDTDWVRDEQEDAESYRDLVRMARADSIVPSEELPKYERWWEQRRPNRFWAKQYTKQGKDLFNAVSELLQRSRAKARAEREQKLLIQKAEKDAFEAEKRAEAAEARRVADKAKEKLRTQKQRAKWIYTCLGIVLLAGSTTLVMVYKEYKKQKENETRLISIVANSVLGARKYIGAADASLILLSKDDNRLPDTKFYVNNLYDSLLYLREERRVRNLSAQVVSVSFNSKKSLVAGVTAGNPPLLYFWRSEDGVLVDRIPIPAELVGNGFVSARWSPDGERLVIGSKPVSAVFVPCSSAAMKKYLAECQSLTLDVVHKFGDEKAPAGNASWSGDGSMILTSFFQTPPMIWNARTGVADASFATALDRLHDENNDFSPAGVAISQANEFIAVGSRLGDIVILDAKTKSVIKTLKIGDAKAFVSSLAFSPIDSNSLLVVYQNASPLLWDIKEEKSTLLDLSGAAGMQGAFDPKGQFIAIGANNGVVTLFKLDRGKTPLPLEMRGHLSAVYTVDIDQDGTIVSGSADKSVRFWSENAVLSSKVEPDFFFSNPRRITALKNLARNNLPYEGDARLKLQEICKFLPNCAH